MQFFRGGQRRGSERPDRFQKFSRRAREVLALAQEEAQRLGHNYIGTEHILLGLIREGEGIGAKVLISLGVSLDDVRTRVMHIIGHGDRIVLGEVGLTPRAKRVMELAVDEARRMNHPYVGTEHLLLGLVREGEGIAAGVLESIGLTLEQVRTATLQMLSAVGNQKDQESAAQPSGARPVSMSAVGSGNGGSSPKNNVVTCRLDDAALDAIDALVETGIRSTRSDAAAWLIGAGIEAHRALFERVYATVTEIRQLRAEAQAIAQQAPQAAADDAARSDEPAPPDTIEGEHAAQAEQPEAPEAPEAKNDGEAQSE